MNEDTYSLVAVGTGFATSSFLHRFLQNSPKNIKVLVLEAGERFEHKEQVERRHDPKFGRGATPDLFINKTPEKSWAFYQAFGGGSNCWWACTPRFLPEDFELKTRYGVGRDWPISYEDLEPFYCDAEHLMQISGDSENSPYPRSRPYPHGPHRLSDPDKILMAAYPGQFFPHPCARSTGAVPGQRAACCNNSKCNLCPIDAKFTIQNGMKSVYSDPRVEIRYGTTVETLEYSSGKIDAVRYRSGGASGKVKADLFALGTNAIFNPHILLRSGIQHKELGKGICEQRTQSVDIDLDGVDNFQGSTTLTGLGYMFYSGDHRKTRAAALVQTSNNPVHSLRNVRGKWLKTLRLNFIYEDFRQPENVVEYDPEIPDKPIVRHPKHSALTDAGIASTKDNVEKLLQYLPAEGYELQKPWETDFHNQCTTPMGDDPETSIVDRNLVHHQYRNLVVLGASVFATAAPPNPTLTLTALSLMSAQALTS